MFFKDQIKKRIKNEKGLTLVELLAVIVILGIIAAIAVPAIGNIIANSRAKAVISDAQNALNAANLYYTDGNKDAFAITAAVSGGASATDNTSGYLESKGTIKTLSVTTTTPYEITFTADLSGTDVAGTGLTLDDLNNIEVEKGKYKFKTGYTPTGEIDNMVSTTP